MKIHNRAKLTEKDVEKIILMRIKGCTHLDIAKKFNVHYTTIQDICIGKSWNHIYHLYKNELKSGRVFVSLTAGEGVVTISSGTCSLMVLGPSSKISFMLDEHYFLIKKDNKNGLPLSYNSYSKTGLKLERATLVSRIREKYDLDRHRAYRIMGIVQNEIFKSTSMEIINQLNAPRKNGNGSVVPYILVSKITNTVRFSSALVALMEITVGDKIIVGKDRGKLFLAISNDDNGFNIKGKRHSVSCNSSRFGSVILGHFGLGGEEKSHKILVNHTPLKKDGLTFFELKL